MPPRILLPNVNRLMSEVSFIFIFAFNGHVFAFDIDRKKSELEVLFFFLESKFYCYISVKLKHGGSENHTLVVFAGLAVFLSGSLKF